MQGLMWFSQSWLVISRRGCYKVPCALCPLLSGRGDTWLSAFHHELKQHATLIRSQADPSTMILNVQPTEPGTKINLFMSHLASNVLLQQQRTSFRPEVISQSVL